MSTRKPNIVFVFADQLRADALGCYQNNEVRTPRIDQFARESVVFSNAIANAPVCGPSRASLLTGTYPQCNKVVYNDLPLPDGMATIGTVLKDQGYKTGYIGKWHLDGMPRDKFTPPGPRRMGFDNYWAVYNCDHDYFHPKYYLDTPDLVQIEHQYEPSHQTNLALNCLEEWSKSEEPFCLFVSWGPPHDPYEDVPSKYLDLYPDYLSSRPNCPHPDPGRLRQYYAAVTSLDDNFGRILDGLDRLGMADDTIVVFSSDHGDMLGSHGYEQKQLPFEESIRIPLIIRWPGRLERGVNDELIGIADFTPTLLGMTGTQVPVGMQGEDLSSYILSGHCSNRTSVPIMNIVPKGKALKFGVKEPWRGVRTKRFTYATFGDRPWVLFDNSEDPCQVNNLVHSQQYKEKFEELQKETEHWLKRLNDPFLSATPF